MEDKLYPYPTPTHKAGPRSPNQQIYQTAQLPHGPTSLTHAGYHPSPQQCWVTLGWKGQALRPAGKGQLPSHRAQSSRAKALSQCWGAQVSVQLPHPQGQG